MYPAGFLNAWYQRTLLIQRVYPAVLRAALYKILLLGEVNW